MVEQPDHERAAEVKKQLEALAGREIDVSGEQLLKLWFPAGASSYGEGSVTWKSVFIAGKRSRDDSRCKRHVVHRVQWNASVPAQ